MKINIDENPEVAQAFQVQSIPYVVALREQQVVSEFMGVHPEEKLREWLNSLLPSKAEELLKKGQALEATDAKAAMAAYREAAALDAENAVIKIALARVLLKLNLDDESRKIIADLETRGYLEPEAEKVKSQLELRAAAAEAGPLDEARKSAAAAPSDSHFTTQAVRCAGRRQPPRRGAPDPVGHHPQGQSGRRRRGEEHDDPHLRHAGRRLRTRRHLPPQAGDGAVLTVISVIEWVAGVGVFAAPSPSAKSLGANRRRFDPSHPFRLATEAVLSLRQRDFHADE